MRVLAREGITHLLVEGGRRLLEGFLSARLADEVVWFIAPKIIGGSASLAQARLLQNAQFERVGPDLCVRGAF
jgi:diaminohydroxyphosphoribosylaminopyrimidine deaminase/5-amino-6-(5-phosphoribosylamino)uracil reductase